MKWIILLTLFLTINVESVYADDVESEISTLIQKYDAVGVSVAVVKGDEIVYVNSFGYKDEEERIPLSNSDLFRIASVSKTFVATAIMQLVEKGKLTLDDDVNRYLKFKVQNPKFPDVPITVRMLLSHRSSINDSQKWDKLDRIIPKLNSDYEKCYGDFKPGSKYMYCNMNYNILGAVIENVCHKRFDKYIKKKIMSPLGLNGSFNRFDVDSLRFVKSYWYNRKRDKFHSINNVYQPLIRKRKNYILGYHTTDYAPPAGMIINAMELAKYMQMHINGGVYKKKRLVSNVSETEMRVVPNPKNHYALSITHYNNSIIQGEELLGQTGGHLGFHTAMIFHPEKKYGFVVFCNGCKSKSSDMDGYELNFDIIRCLYNNIILSSNER